VFDKLHLVVAPRSDHTVTRKDDLHVKSALFDFLISTKLPPTDSYNLPERFTTVDVTTGSSVFPTSLFYQLIPPREVLRSNRAPYRQYQRRTT